ncbi:hypothetical protein BDB01DRAFT_893530 [Pilobolus umbonatus]|nr:hypothetical protein BDB01DRAFT_893530 [Pilobolus umbonatus]
MQALSEVSGASPSQALIFLRVVELPNRTIALLGNYFLRALTPLSAQTYIIYLIWNIHFALHFLWTVTDTTIFILENTMCSLTTSIELTGFNQQHTVPEPTVNRKNRH